MNYCHSIYCEVDGTCDYCEFLKENIKLKKELSQLRKHPLQLVKENEALKNEIEKLKAKLVT